MKRYLIFSLFIFLLCVPYMFADLGEDFQDAVAKGELDKVRVFISAGADVNAHYRMSGLIPMYPPVGDWTALMTAALHDDTELAELLIHTGADLDFRSECGETALFWGVKDGSINTVIMLIKAGADITLANNAGETPFYKAASMGYTEIAQFLLDSGADWIMENRGIYSPLWVAARNGSWRIVRLLQERGSQPTGNILETAAEALNSTPVIIELLAGGVDVSGVTGSRTLANLIPKGTTEGFRTLLKAGAHPNQNLLVKACDAGRTPMVRLLVEAGIQPDSSFSELTKAAFLGDLEAVQELLADGTEVDRKDRRGRTALIAACLAGRPQVVDYLCAAGAEVNKVVKPPESRRQAPLQLAAAGGDRDICRILLNTGADPNGPAGKSPPLLPLQAAIRDGNVEVVELLIAAGADPGGKDYYSSSPLYHAVQRNAVDIVQALLDAGADPQDAVYFGNTLLHLATLFESPDVIEPLVKAGLDVNAKTSRGKTPLGSIKAMGHYTMAEILRQLGAKE